MPCNFAAFRFCCPTAGCVYFSDTFNRADSTSLGADWTETAGDWSISSNRLSIASASAKATCNTTHPTASTKYIVSVSVTLGTDGDVARVWVNNSGQFAELERITSTCGRLRLYDGATCKGSVNVALGGFTRLVVCTEASKIHVGTGGSPMLTVPATAASSVVALGTGACTGTVYFEDFSLSKHAVDDATCPACGDEGCTWFDDAGCASGSLSTTDWTVASGTWAYGEWYEAPAVVCSADGTAAIAVTDPLDPRGAVIGIPWQVPDIVDLTLRIYYDSDTTTYIQIKVLPAGFYRTAITAWSGGTQYGPTVNGFLNSGGQSGRLCFDGTTLTAMLVGPTQATVSLPHVPTACAPRISVSGLSGGESVYWHLMGLKSTVDVAGCQGCGNPGCTNCTAGSFANHATVTIAGITSNAYGCTCTDQTIDLYATSSGCQWTGTKTGPCSSGTWTATATVAAVAGGYKLTVLLATTSGAGATWENTVLSGSPVDCLTAFDGAVPWVSASGSGNCTFGSATCTFATP